MRASEAGLRAGEWPWVDRASVGGRIKTDQGLGRVEAKR